MQRVRVTAVAHIMNLECDDQEYRRIGRVAMGVPMRGFSGAKGHERAVVGPSGGGVRAATIDSKAQI